jgi:N-acetyl-anhydromuramyl-L-alanine amidase AmpD
VTSVPLPGTVFLPFGSSSQAFLPPYQIATHFPERPATAKLWPVTALSPQSFACVVPTPFYDLATRPDDGLAVRYVVIHDTEVEYDTTVALFQNPLAYVSAHYVLRSSDGQVTQMVPTHNVAWHAGNWWVNTHAVGIENEGFATQGNLWFTNRMYHSIARLTRYLAERYELGRSRLCW